MSVNIAIVDDDEAILDSLQLLLEDHGWRIWTYPTGEAYLLGRDRPKPDCLILDPHLPGLSGAEVARRASNGRLDIPIIGLSARPCAPLAIELVAAGALVMMQKPVTEKELVAQIESAIHRVDDEECTHNE